jgi:hypothetical protein
MAEGVSIRVFTSRSDGIGTDAPLMARLLHG